MLRAAARNSAVLSSWPSSARAHAKSSRRSSRASGTAPQPDQRAKTACSAGSARRPSACSVRTVRNAARLARTRVTAPDGARSSWLSGANRGAARSTSGSATGMGGPSPAPASTPPSVTVALSIARRVVGRRGRLSVAWPSLAGCSAARGGVGRATCGSRCCWEGSGGRESRRRAAACSTRSACQVSTCRRSSAATPSRCSMTSACRGGPSGSASCRQRSHTALATSRLPLIRARSTTGSRSSRPMSSSAPSRMARFMPARACTVCAAWSVRSREGRSRKPRSRDSSPLPGLAGSAEPGVVTARGGGQRTPISGTSCSSRHCSLSRVFIAAIRNRRSRLADASSDSRTPANSATSSSAGTAIARSAVTRPTRLPSRSAATAAAWASRIASASMPGSSNDVDAGVSTASGAEIDPARCEVRPESAPSPSRSPVRSRPAAGPAPRGPSPRPSASRC